MNYYTPAPEKLAALGFALREDGCAWVGYNPPVSGSDPWRIYPPSPNRNVVTISQDGMPRFEGRLRTEKEFDLLLWQIGWTDKEPASAVVSRDFMLPG